MVARFATFINVSGRITTWKLNAQILVLVI